MLVTASNETVNYRVPGVILAALVMFAVGVQLIGQANAQLYLVTGLATPDETFKVGSTVYSVDPLRRAMTPLVTLVGPDSGSRSIVADHQLRLLVITEPNVNPTELVVLDMDSPQAPRRVPIALDGSLLETSILDRMTDVWVALGTANLKNGFRYRLEGISVANSDPGQEALPVADYRHMRRQGWWAPADESAWTFNMKVEDGRAITRQGGGTVVDMNFPVPTRFQDETDQTFMLAVNNDDLLVIDRAKERGRGIRGPVGFTHLSVYDKKAESWHDVVFEGGGTSVRSFGHWLALNEAQVKLDLSSSPVVRAGNERESQGVQFRQQVLNRQDAPKDQVTVDSLFLKSPLEFQGALHLYDSRSRKKYTIRTGQGDSEVLLIEGAVVYYRVNDSLYRAEVSADRIINTTEILRDEKVQLAHWAFLDR